MSDTADRRRRRETYLCAFALLRKIFYLCSAVPSKILTPVLSRRSYGRYALYSCLYILSGVLRDLWLYDQRSAGKRGIVLQCWIYMRYLYTGIPVGRCTRIQNNNAPGCLYQATDKQVQGLLSFSATAIRFTSEFSFAIH